MSTLFKFFISFAILYNGYIYFFPWDGTKPLSPLYISILKDIPWAIVVISCIYNLFRNKKVSYSDMYQRSNGFKTMSVFFIFAHLMLLSVAILHLSHKNLIDVLQRDIKNVQYIFLPSLFPLIIKKEKDITDYVNWLIGIGIIVSLFGYIVHFFITSFTWEGAVLSTFQTPNSFGFFMVMLSLIVLSKIFVEKSVSSFWYVIFCIFYGALLISVSISALLAFLAGTLFLVFITKPVFRILLKTGIFFIISCSLFYVFGFYDAYLHKLDRSLSSYQKTSTKAIIEKLHEEKETKWWEILDKPYCPVNEKRYQSLSQHTTVTGRLIYFKEFLEYIKSAKFIDIMLGDFTLKHYFEYDNVYFYFIRNNGLIVCVLLFILLCSGVFTGLIKYRLFCKVNNNKMASLSVGITAVLLTSILIQFNLSYFLTIYPLNFLTYFFLLLIFFINPFEYSNSCSNKS